MKDRKAGTMKEDRDLVEGLNRPAWSRLQHSFGGASDGPQDLEWPKVNKGSGCLQGQPQCV